MLRKMAVAAASKPHVEIQQNGEHFHIKTSTSLRTTEIDFTIGEEFQEETVDGRKCKVTGERRPICIVLLFSSDRCYLNNPPCPPEFGHLGNGKQDLLQTDFTERQRPQDLLEPRTEGGRT